MGAGELESILERLPAAQRLAAAYAPRRARPGTVAMLAFDARLAGVVRSAREPMLGQLRLAWWRDQLALDPDHRATGEPLLALLGIWPGNTEVLTALIDGWEGLLGEAPLPAAPFEALAAARGMAWAALAHGLGEAAAAPEAERAGCNWGLIDLARGLSDPQEQAAVSEIVRQRDWRRARLTNSLRPLAVLHALAARARGGGDLLSGPGAMLASIRVGLLGL